MRRRVLLSLVALSLALLVLVLALQQDSTQTVMLDVDGEERMFLLVAPRQAEDDPPLSVVFNLHGWTGSAAGMQRNSGMDQLAAQAGFIAVFPQALDRGAGRIWVQADVAFFDAVLAQLRTEYRLDEERVYLNGFSAGGMMAQYLAATQPQRYAAVVSRAGLLPGVEGMAELGGAVTGVMQASDIALPEPPARAVPIMLVHGRSDITVPFGAHELLSDLWRGWNGCDDNAASQILGDGVQRTDYADCAEGAAVSLLEFESEPDSHFVVLDDLGVESAAVYWDFLSRHALPEAG